MSETSSRSSAPLPFLGLCCGVGVSTIYLCQPLLPAMAASFHATASQAGLVAVGTQVGYALGLLFFVPLGDTVERRSLMTRLYAAVAVALCFVALAPTLPLLILASAFAGGLACVTHIALPIAPDLAAPKERGKAIGIVMTGLLLGVLLARTFAGWINDAALHLTNLIAGWRVVFLVAGLISIVFSLAIPRVMPVLPPKQHLRYAEAMRSVWTVFREEPLLRESALMGALCFGAFSVFWNTLAFLLATHGLGAGVAGSFGLVGAAGALVAGYAGKVSDRRGPRYIMTLALGVLALSFGLIYGTERLSQLGTERLSQLGTERLSALADRLPAVAAHGGHFPLLPYLAGLVVGVVLMDMGMQSAQIANQTRIFALRPEARSRINTVYMVSYFTGAAVSSALSTVAWQHFGVTGTSALEGFIVLLAVLRHMSGDRQPYRRPASLPDADLTRLEL